jgi:hypothetical protein
VKAGWIVASAVDGAAVVIGHLSDELRPGKLSQRRAPANQAETHRKLRPQVTPGHSPLEPKSRPVAREMLEIADYEL